MAVYDRYLGKTPSAMYAGMPALAVFDINEEEAVTGYYEGDGVYAGLRRSKVHTAPSGRSYLIRGTCRVYLDEIVRTGTPWLPEAPECKSIKTT